MVPTKLLCYTRSSAMTMEVFPMEASKSSCSHLRDYVYSQQDSLYLCTFSSRLSKIDFEKHVKEFLQTKKYEVFLLAVHIEGDSKQMYQYVNHLRIIIEQIENEISTKEKLFVCLLLLPATQLFTSNYPCYFLRGWDLHYLDSISPTVSTNQQKSSLMISDWFTQLCLPTDSTTKAHESTLDLLKELVSENIIPVVVARVYSGKYSNYQEHCQIKHSDRNLLIRRLLLKHGISDVLCCRFHQYWDEDTMNEYLLTAANDIYWHHSTLSLADQMHVTLRFLFANFIVYMLKEVNACYGFDILHQKIVLSDEDVSLDSDSNCLLTLLSEMLQYIQVPDISMISIYNDEDSDSRLLLKQWFQGSHCRLPLSHTLFQLFKAIVDHSRQTLLNVNKSTGVTISEGMIVKYAADNWQSALQVCYSSHSHFFCAVTVQIANT